MCGLSWRTATPAVAAISVSLTGKLSKYWEKALLEAKGGVGGVAVDVTERARGGVDEKVIGVDEEVIEVGVNEEIIEVGVDGGTIIVGSGV